MKRIFYTKNFNEEINEKVDLILSPEFYWIKKLDVKIKNLKEAKKIAENMFNIQNAYYDAFKINGNVFVIAIPKEIDFKIDKKYINSIRLAQSEFYPYDAIYINDNMCLKKINDIIFLIKEKIEPKNNISDILTTLKLSKYEISFLNSEKIDLIKKFNIILIIFLISLIIRNISEYKTIKEINLEYNSLSKYNLPLNLYQLKSIYESLKQFDIQQQQIREKLFLISKLNIKKILYIEYKNGVFYLKIKSNKNLKKIFEKKFKLISYKSKKSIIEVVIK